ncbi:mandelate racemase/muconate lactonizing enzyme family protein [Candidatus Borrarchaeum sp.]|uniref:mandelate racemase/muconate lactonizing enzyme family protein n=1 Tax=Candidatus Borrarchaeum sp. TaxID=2846742 RepID=UPI00257DA008|nr:mandelate racemase/muconate lactonizing enzyme family protein [Candidatus Borrarchaeum sp.]
MKITDVKVIKLGVQLPKPLGVSKDREFNSRGAALVIIDTDEGIQGIGEGYGPESYIVKTIVDDKFKPLLIGQDPLDIERLWRTMLMDPVFVYWDQKGQGVSAASGVDMALWDIAGKFYNAPIYKLLGGDAKGNGKVKAYASDLFWDTPEIMAESARQFALQGYSAVKTHLGRGLKEDEERVKAIKDAIGDVDLMIDMNCGYDRVEAFKVGKMLEKYDIYWYEEPLSPYDIDGLAYLKNKLDIPIATGENEYTKWGFKELFLKNAVDFAMPDIMRCGGITETKKICALAEAFDVICTPHNYTTGVGLAATLQVMACTPNCEWLEFDVTDYALYKSLLKKPLEFDGQGMVTIPTDPGLGVELKDNVVDKYLIP